MGRYLITRFGHAVIVVVGVALVVFLLTHLGGDPASLLLPPNASAQEIADFRHAMGFDKPIPLQLLDYLGRIAHGDFGQSFRYNQPAMEVVLERVGNTLVLGGFALALSVIIAGPLGILAAVRRNSIWDSLSLIVSLSGQALPVFWFGILLVILFAVVLRWLPASGGGDLAHLVLPGVTLAAYSLAIISRLLRSSLLEVLDADYVRTARAKGLREGLVLTRHALKNALLPVVTVLGLQVGTLLGGAVVTEEVFAYPGMGRLAVQAILGRDFSLIQAFVVLTAITIVITNLLVDLAYAWLDPRVRLRR
ncbi:MAG: ABC transporter permease [Chloroflexota bacterium]